MKRLALLAILFFACPCFGEIRAVIFDHGGVMVSMNREIVLQCLEHRMNISQEDLQGHSTRQMAMGLCDERTFWDDISGGTLPNDWETHFRQAYIEASVPNQGMLWLVQTLRSAGYQTPLLSNALPSSVAANRMEGRYRLFDPVIVSCEVGMAKPSQDIYRYTLDLLDLEAHECLFIDDRLENLVPAADLGMEVIHFLSFDQLCHELGRRGILGGEQP